MFQRQWFPSQAQSSLSEKGLVVNELLNKNDIEQVLTKILQFHIESRKQKDKYLEIFWLRQFHRITHIQSIKQKPKVEGKLVLCVSFCDFWGGFDPIRSEIWRFLNTVMPTDVKLEINESKQPDIEICSCFRTKINGSFKSMSSTRILFLGESVKPSFYEYDYSISMFPGSLHGLNAYLPLWCLRLDRYANIYDESYEPLKESSLTSKMIVPNKGKTISFVGNNYTPEREALLTEFRKYGWEVKEFGAKNKVKSKSMALKTSTFNLAIENCSIDGYITEKLFDAFTGQTIPVYNRTNGCDRFVDLNSFMHYYEHENYNKLVDKCNQVILENSNYIELPPILTRNTIESIIKRAMETIEKWCRIYA